DSGDISVSPNDAASRFRLFVGAGGSINISGKSTQGAIYAPTATLNVSGTETINGAVFVKQLNGSGELHVNYSSPAAPGGGIWEGGGGGTGTPDAGSPGGGGETPDAGSPGPLT